MNMTRRALCLYSVLCLLSASCSTKQDEKSGAPNLEDVIADAYFHTFPIVENYKAIYAYSVLESSPRYLPMNQMAHEAKLYTPADRFVVSPNNDTFYSTANLDLRAEPVVLKVPEITDRYYSFQIISGVTDNFAYVGTNSTGTGAGIYAITPPDYQGELPAEVVQIKSPSFLIGVIGRTQVNASDPADIARVKNIQSQYQLGPLSRFYPEYEPKPVGKIDFPEYSPEAMKDERFFVLLNFLLQFTQLADDEQRIIDSYADIGVKAGQPYTFFSDNAELQDEILAGIRKGIQRVDSSSQNMGKVVNGWTMFPLGEYFGDNYKARTNIAKIGIYANSPEEAYYPLAFVDGNGDELTGTRQYKITFPADSLPPARYFWSLTMYDGESQLLVENELQRYSIGDRTSTMKPNADGSLTIYFGSEPPPQGTGNWLPAPEGAFNVMLRLYGPGPEVLNGKWAPPPIIPLN